MKVKIKTYNGSLADYLSLDKVYDVAIIYDDTLMTIVNDEGGCSTILIPECAHLNGGSWEIVND